MMSYMNKLERPLLEKEKMLIVMIIHQAMITLDLLVGTKMNLGDKDNGNV